MAEHLATPDQWFASSAHDRTIYFVSERVEHQRPPACTVDVSPHVDNGPMHFRAPTPVR